MAITKTITANGYNSVAKASRHKFSLRVTEDTTSGNSSLMDYSFILAPIQTGWDWADWGDKISYEIKFTEKVVNEETKEITTNELYKKTGTMPAYNGSSTVILASGSDIEIPHNSDGTKTIDISFKVTDTTGQSYTCGNASASGSMELTDLHTSPDLSLSSITENNTNLTGVDGTTFVTYLSKKIFTVGYTLYDDATVKSIKIYDRVGNELTATITIGMDSATIEVDFSKQNLPSNAIVNNITSFSIELTDSMNGMTSLTTVDYTVIPYFLPNLITTSSSVKRNGQTTGKALLNLLGSFYNADIGSLSNWVILSFKYWKTGTEEPNTYYEIPTDGYSITENAIKASKWKIAIDEEEITDVDKSYAYKFKIKAIDSFGNTSEIELTCSKGEWLMAKFKDKIDFKRITIGSKDIVESGETENTTYTKYYDGRMICTGKVTTDILTWGQDSIIWHSRNHTLPDFPVEFIEPPHVVKDIESMNISARSIWISGNSAPTTKNPGTYNLATYWNASDTTCTVTYIAIGKWK